MDDSSNISNFGFFTLCNTDASESGYVGALLVTDDRGVPLEFKCTEVIRPSQLQRTLYGNRMKPHIATKLCGIPLLKAVVNKPKVLFVNVASHLEIRTELEIPTLFVERAANAGSLDSDGIPGQQNAENTDNPIVRQTYIVSQPHQSYPADKNEEIFQSLSFDFIEPFGRIKTAVELLGKQDQRFK